MILYRGPLERRRLSMLLAAAERAYGKSPFVWVVPNGKTDVAPEIRNLVDEFPGISSVHILDGRWGAFWPTLRSARRILSNPARPLLGLGFSSLPYVQRVASATLAWTLHGIPEERLLHQNDARARALVRASWTAGRFGRKPDLMIAVTETHAKLALQRLHWDIPTIAVPSCADITRFKPTGTGNDRRFLTYLGSAAPWQSLDRLAAIWREVYRLRPDVRFRVISRHERTRVLGAGLPEGAVEYVSGFEAEQIGAFLHDALLGFVIREDSIVNRISFPVKISEYLAAEVPIVVSDLSWDPAAFVRRTEVGAVVSASDALDAARDIVTLLAKIAGEPDRFAAACRSAAREVGFQEWSERLADALPMSGAHALKHVESASGSPTTEVEPA